MLSKVTRKLNQQIKLRRSKILARGKTKYFCIGRNKTGTTSIKKAFMDLGYPIGDQPTAQLLANRCYFDGNFDPIIAYCKTAQVFQDAPFSWPDTYKYIDQAYPGSKFILTLRDDAEQWYKSITRFHSKLFGNGNLPTAEDLRAAKFARMGFMYKAVKLHGAPDDDIYNEEIMIDHYNRYNQGVQRYFSKRRGDLLVVNLAEMGSYNKFINFIGVDSPFEDFPWENKT